MEAAMHDTQVQRGLFGVRSRKPVPSLSNPLWDKLIWDDAVSVQLRGQRNITFSLYS